MTKILITYNSRYGDTYYLYLKNALLKEGNDVFMVNWINKYKIENNTCIEIGNYDITEKIKTFKPELIFCFNNFCPNEIIEKAECPICIFEADMAYMFK